LSPDRPGVFEMPPGTLSNEELEKYGVVDIIQGQETQLFIRKEAFEEGGILYDLKRTQSSDNPVKLRIVLVDGPYVSNDYVGNDKYADVRIMVPQRTWGTEDFRKYQIDDLQSAIDKNLVNIKKFYNPKKNFASQSNQYFEAYYSVMAFRNSAEDYKSASFEQLTQKINSLAHEPAGIYVAPTKTDNTATIFIAVGESVTAQEQIRLFVQPDGTITPIPSAGITSTYVDYRANMLKSFPRMTDFQINQYATEQNNDYPIGAQNNESGENLNHEIMHLNKITLRPLLDGVKPDYSEYNTDMAAIQQMDQEYLEWIGKGENLQKNPYPFVFKSGNFYQITRNEKENSEPQI
jgi:hypothetical protein